MQGQTSCGTPDMDSTVFLSKPWIGNNQFLEDITDSIGYGGASTPKSAYGGFDPMAAFWIPVKAWVYNDDNGNGGISEAAVEESVRKLNEYFAGEVNNTGNAHAHILMQFYLRCDIAYIDNSTYAFNPSNSEANDMWDNHYETATLNIHYIQTHDDYAGLARLPGSNKSFTCNVVKQYNAHLTSTLPHEIGHAFDLLHTHRGRCGDSDDDNNDCGNCKQEAVSRAKIQPVSCFNFSGDLKCEVNGDGLCDTEADPKLYDSDSEILDVQQTSSSIPWTFEYTGVDSDNWGDDWTPDVYNIMSYSDPRARERFSPSQIGIMYYWALGIIPDFFFPSQYNLHIANEFVDIFEPDNQRHDDSVHRIDFGLSQHRGLHAERSGLKSNPSFGYCDEDWVLFTIPSITSAKVNIETEASGSAQQVNTEIFLYEDDGTTQLAYNDNKATGNIYSKIEEIELTPGDYWIRVKGVGNVSGEYLLNLDYCGEECCFQPLIGSASQITSTSGPFNLGLMAFGRTEYFGNSVTIAQNGQFLFNDSSPLGFNEPQWPLASQLEAVVCNNAVITVGSTGLLKVGDSSSGRTAQVSFSDGTALELNSSGTIEVESGSSLFIDSGAEFTLNGGTINIQDDAELRIHADALMDMDGGTIRITGSGKLTIDATGVMEYTAGDIFLNGYDASFALGGVVKISGDVEFKLASETGGPTGFLHIQDSNSYPEWHFESYGLNNEILLKGNDKQQQLLLVDDHAEFRVKGAGDDPLRQVRIQYGKVNLGIDARVQLDAKSNEMRHVRQYGPGSRGVHLYDKGNFYYSHFENTAGIKAIMTWSGARITTYLCLFESGADVEVEDGSFNVSKCTFDYGTELGSEGLSGPSYISTCTFTESSISNHSNGSVIRMTNSTMTNDSWETGEFYSEGGQFELRCNTFDRYHLVFTSTLLNMSIIDNAGYNVFSGTNGRYIFMDHPASTIDLDYGYNTFYDSSVMPQFEIISSQINPSPLNIDAEHNYWQKYVPMFQSDIDEGPVAARFDGGYGLYELTINVTDPHIDVLTACGTQNSPKSLSSTKGDKEGEVGSKSLSADPIISTSFADTIALSHAIEMVADTMRFYNDSLGNDLVAIDMFSEIFQYDFDTLTESVDPHLERAFQFMKTSVEHAFATDTLLVEDNQSSFHPLVQKYVDVLMLRSDSVINEENYVEQFYLEIDKAQLFNTIGRKEMCWALLDNLDNCPLDSTEQDYLNSWLTLVGQQLINIQVGMDNFDPDSLVSTIDTTLFTEPVPLTADEFYFGARILGVDQVQYTNCGLIDFKLMSSSEEQKFFVYPNPTTGILTIAIAEKSAMDVTFELRDLKGNLLRQYPIRSKTGMAQMDISELSNGTYIYRLLSNDVILDSGQIIKLR
jgi:hypothetical protein